ncbi:MAG: hypothetical protein EOP48_24320 [Sphingobacteriales bacterium]|nr:MAG: hypothetical protein EOP48_24320 [Sphingobacteriales bacterium]
MEILQNPIIQKIPIAAEDTIQKPLAKEYSTEEIALSCSKKTIEILANETMRVISLLDEDNQEKPRQNQFFNDGGVQTKSFTRQKLTTLSNGRSVCLCICVLEESLPPMTHQ